MLASAGAAAGAAAAAAGAAAHAARHGDGESSTAALIICAVFSIVIMAVLIKAVKG